MGSALGGIFGGIAGMATGSDTAGVAQNSGQIASQSYQGAAGLEQQQQVANTNNLNPYIQAGQSDVGPLASQYQNTAGALGTAYNNAQSAIPMNMTQSQLEQTPGYQFTLNQGLAATQNSNAAHGLGVSSNALNGAANYATGLANNTYMNQFNMAQQQYQDYANQYTNQLAGQNAIYNQLYGPSALGASSASSLGTLNNQAVNAQGGYLGQAGTALASGNLASAQIYQNAMTQGAQSIGYGVGSIAGGGMGGGGGGIGGLGGA